MKKITKVLGALTASSMLVAVPAISASCSKSKEANDELAKIEKYLAEFNALPADKKSGEIEASIKDLKEFKAEINRSKLWTNSNMDKVLNKFRSKFENEHKNWDLQIKNATSKK